MFVVLVLLREVFRQILNGEDARVAADVGQAVAHGVEVEEVMLVEVHGFRCSLLLRVGKCRFFPGRLLGCDKKCLKIP